MKERHLRLVSLLLPALLLFAAFSQALAFGNIEELRRKAEDTRKEVAELERVLKALDESITARLERIEGLETEIEQTEISLRQAETELTKTEIKLTETSSNFASRLRAIYMKGSMSYLEMLLEAESLGSLGVRAVYITRILQSDARLISAIKGLQARHERAVVEMEQKHQTLQSMRFNREAERRNLAGERREKERLLTAAKSRLEGELARITPQAERLPGYAVVLDNAPQARPQHGLARAGIVYEYEVEGRTTRYLALFASFPTKVGPIRSARTHSAMLALEHGVNFIYTSAGVDVLAQIRSWKMDGTNALISDNRSFYRDSARRAPHNLYVNLSTLGVRAQAQEVVIRPAYLSREGAAADTITLQYGPAYRLRYEYNAKTGAYRRYVNDVVHRDGTGEEIRIRNIIIQYAPHFLDQQRRPTPNLIGTGRIDFYALGEHFAGTWRKDVISSPTRFFFGDGQEIERINGLTWIQVVRSR